MNRRSWYFDLRSFFLLQAAAGIAMMQGVSAQEITDLGESVILPTFHYRLDESSGTVVHEARGNGLDGVIQTNRAELAAKGIRGGAIRFDGESVVVIPDVPNLDLGRDGFTVSLFARRAERGKSEHDNDRVLAKIPGDNDGGGYDITFRREAIVARYYEPFDYFMSELMFASCDPVRLFQRHEAILQAGKALIYHPPKANSGEPMEYMKPLTRAVIGYTYAMGGWLAAPYDLFIGAGIPRYFGKPEDYADLYGFIRANTKYLDGLERAAYAGAWLGDQTAGNVLVIEGGSGGVYAFARTTPNEPEAPIVIHLVDWGEELEFIEGRFRDQAGFNSVSYKRGAKAPFALKVRRANCYGARSFTARLLTPPPYDSETHWQAERTGDYSALSESRPIAFQTRGGYAEFQIPKLDPYALLVLQANGSR